jgi:hypothetical protein
MPKTQKAKVHTVKATLQVVDLSKAGSALELAVYANSRKIGRAVIGHGSLPWYGNKWRHGRRIDWSQLADYFERADGTV